MKIPRDNILAEFIFGEGVVFSFCN